MSEQLVKVASSTWLEKVSKAYMNNCAYLKEFDMAGCIQGINFGADIKKGTILASNNADPTDADGNGITSQNENATTSASFNFKYTPKKIPISMEMLNLKGSPEERVQWLVGEYESGAGSIINSVEYQVAGDGTTFGGLAIDGFGAAASTTPEIGSYGGIDSAVEIRWRNKAYNTLDTASGLPDAGTPMKDSNIVDRVRIVIEQGRFNGKSYSHLFLSPDWYSMFTQALEERQRVVSIDGQNAGQENVSKIGYGAIYYMGVKIVNAGGLKRTDAGVLIGHPPKTGYFLTLDPKIILLTFYDRAKYDKEFRELLKLDDASKTIESMIFPNMENGNLFHKNNENSAYYSELRFTGNLTVGDRTSLAVLFEQEVPEEV